MKLRPGGNKLFLTDAATTDKKMLVSFKLGDDSVKATPASSRNVSKKSVFNTRKSTESIGHAS